MEGLRAGCYAGSVYDTIKKELLSLRVETSTLSKSLASTATIANVTALTRRHDATAKRVSAVSTRVGELEELLAGLQFAGAEAARAQQRLQTEVCTAQRCICAKVRECLTPVYFQHGTSHSRAECCRSQQRLPNISQSERGKKPVFECLGFVQCCTVHGFTKADGQGDENNAPVFVSASAIFACGGVWCTDGPPKGIPAPAVHICCCCAGFCSHCVVGSSDCAGYLLVSIVPHHRRCSRHSCFREPLIPSRTGPLQ